MIEADGAIVEANATSMEGMVTLALVTFINCSRKDETASPAQFTLRNTSILVARLVFRISKQFNKPAASSDAGTVDDVASSEE